MNASKWFARSGAFFAGDATALARGGAVAVIGLGRFGSALACELTRLGIDVIGIDANEVIIDELRDTLAFVARGDSTDEELLRQLGVHEADLAVVCIGSDLEASILTVSRLLKFDGPKIWAKAISEPHAEILEQMGVVNTVRPERDMGKRLAHLLKSHLHDFVGIDEEFAIARMPALGFESDTSVRGLRLRERFGVAVVGIKRAGGHWELVDEDTIVYPEDEIIVAGGTEGIERLTTRG